MAELGAHKSKAFDYVFLDYEDDTTNTQLVYSNNSGKKQRNSINYLKNFMIIRF